MRNYRKLLDQTFPRITHDYRDYSRENRFYRLRLVCMSGSISSRLVEIRVPATVYSRTAIDRDRSSSRVYSLTAGEDGCSQLPSRALELAVLEARCSSSVSISSRHVVVGDDRSRPEHDDDTPTRLGSRQHRQLRQIRRFRGELKHLRGKTRKSGRPTWHGRSFNTVEDDGSPLSRPRSVRLQRSNHEGGLIASPMYRAPAN